MTESVTIVVPSHNRAGMVTTHKALDIDYVCVAESQAEQYRLRQPELNVVAHPDSVIGMHQKRQWMYDQFGSLMMFDDDVRCVNRIYQGQVRMHPSRVDRLAVREIVNNLYQMACDADCYLFGLSMLSSPLAYRPFLPFRFTGLIFGCSFGIRAGSKLSFHPDMIHLEDTWIGAQNAHFHRKVIIDNRYFTQTIGFLTRPGGLQGIRSNELEEREWGILLDTFGENCFPLIEGESSTAKCHIRRRWKSPF